MKVINNDIDESKDFVFVTGYKYEIATFTGNRFGAGTDSNVFVILFGDNGNSGKKILEHTGANDFERGQ